MKAILRVDWGEVLFWRPFNLGFLCNGLCVRPIGSLLLRSDVANFEKFWEPPSYFLNLLKSEVLCIVTF